MNINILHMYGDLLNLYGESGNLKALMYHLKSQGIEVNIDNLSLYDDIDFNKYDLIYIGCGTENNLLIALGDIKRYKDEIRKYIDNNKFFICTGNSLDLFGKKVNELDALDIFDYETSFISKRETGDRIVDYNLDNKIIGFLNNGSKIVNNKYLLFSDELGFNYNNFYGTYLLGPLFVRNPDFTKLIVSKLIKSKYEDFELKDVDTKLDEEAYNSYFNTYYEK